MTFSEALGYAISGVAILAIWVGLMLLLRRSVRCYWGIDKMLEATRSIDESLPQALDGFAARSPTADISSSSSARGSLPTLDRGMSSSRHAWGFRRMRLHP
jgi:hypothetical protein